MRTIKGTTEYTRGYRPHETFQYEIQRERERASAGIWARFHRRVDIAEANLAVLEAKAAKFRALAKARGLVHA